MATSYSERIEASKRIIEEQKKRIRAIEAKQRAEERKLKAKSWQAVGQVFENALGEDFGGTKEELQALVNVLARERKLCQNILEEVKKEIEKKKEGD